ncbi:methyl-accepting chemotaxis protein [Glaciecola siphonariae]|uniref:Methyl-accepting chemotaxis protein n=1 Tax=Glaciecola siphonariae TaxID=521012 RepID=A0ABV9LVL4_9ALTE
MQSWLSKKIALLSLTPVIILVGFIIFNIVISSKQLSTASLTKIEAEFAQFTNSAIAEIQKERGMSAGYLSSDGQSFGSELKRQRLLVDAALDKVFTYNNLEEIPNVEAELLTQLSLYQSNLSNLRKNIDNLNLSLSANISEYSEATELLLDFNGRMVASVKNALGKQKLVILYKLARLQENAGLERALVSTIFADSVISAGQLIRVLELTKAQTEKINDIRVLSTKEFSGEFSKLINSPENKGVDAFRSQLQSNKLTSNSEAWFKAATARINKIDSAKKVLFSQLILHADEDYETAFYMVIFDVILLIVVSLLAVATFSVLSLRKQQSSELKQKLEVMQTQQDLSLRIEKISSDDLGQVAQLLNSLIEQFCQDLGTFQDNALEIASASEQSAASSSATSENSAKQQREVSSSLMLAKSVELGIKEDVKSLAELSKYTKLSADKVKEGEAIVQSAVVGIRSTADEVKKVGNTIEELNAKVGDILKMVDVIRSVAEQTNLLALNAAIEAARAGEQGRGFAVVADEVRALAKRTQDSTEEIANVVDNLNASSTKAFDSIASGVQTADNAVTSSDEISRALGEVAENMKQLERLALNADQSAQQQGSSITYLTQNIESVDKMSEENAHGSGQVASAAYQLSRVASRMLENIRKYKVN